MARMADRSVLIHTVLHRTLKLDVWHATRSEAHHLTVCCNGPQRWQLLLSQAGRLLIFYQAHLLLRRKEGQEHPSTH